MQKPPQASFVGQVKRGLENWKNGRIDFYVDTDTGYWTVRLYYSVNPKHVIHQIKSPLGKSANIVFRCSRLIIGDKRDGELHVKINGKDVANAQKLVKKITSLNGMSTPNHNRAEVGLASSHNGLSGSKVNVKVNGGMVTPTSPGPRSDGWLSKKTGPTTPQTVARPLHASSAKRKIQLDGGDISSKGTATRGAGGFSEPLCNGDPYALDDDEEDDEISFPHFTGMKDYSKSQRNSINGGLTNGLGTTSFYGAQNTLLADNTYKGLNWKSTSQSQQVTKSPKVKRPKLADLEDADRENRAVVAKSKNQKGMLALRMQGKTPTLSDPQDNDQEETSFSQEGSEQNNQSQTVGFDNLGNTCFLNSPLQCLSSLEPLSLDIQSAIRQFGPHLPHNSITRMLYTLMKDVRKRDVRPERVREILTRLRHDFNVKFELNTQQDAHELLAELLDRTDEEVKAILSKRRKGLEGRSPASTSRSTSPSSPEKEAGKNRTDEGSSVSPVKEESEENMRSTPTEANFTWFYKTSFYFHDCKTELVSNQNERESTLMLAFDTRTGMNLQDCIDKYFESSEVDMRCEKCGKEEKVTMTKKIVRRPRCFILNLLRYQSHNLEAKKKLDSVIIPRYMSVVEFCAEDVKAAPSIEPVFMLDRVPFEPASSSPPEKASADFAIEAARHGRTVALEMAAAMRQRQQNNDEADMNQIVSSIMDASFSDDFSGGNAGQVTEEESTSDERRREKRRANRSETDEQRQERILHREIAEDLLSHISEVESHINEAQGTNENLGALYKAAKESFDESMDLAQALTVSDYPLEEGESKDSTAYRKAENLTLCIILLKKALKLEPPLEESFRCHVLIRRLMMMRSQDRNSPEDLLTLANDLAMYISAQELGLIMPDSPKRRKVMASNPGTRQVDHSYDMENVEMKTVHAEVNMEEDRGNRGSIEVYPSPGQKNSSMEERLARLGDNGSSKSSRHTGGRGTYKTDLNSSRTRHRKGEDHGITLEGEEESGTLADVSNNATINTTTRSVSFDMGFLGADSLDEVEPILLGRPLRLWTEAELKGVDASGLTEDDQYLIAQSLSRFEYERELRGGSPSRRGEEVSAGSEVSKEPIDGQDLDSLLKFTGSGESVSASDVICQEKSVSKGSNPADSSTNDGGRGSGARLEHSRRVPELHCEETLSDVDEPDGLVDSNNNNNNYNNNSGVARPKGLKGGQPVVSDTLRDSGGGGQPERACASCGQSALRGRKPCTCWKDCSSSADAGIDKNMVLSPSKALVNQANRQSSRSPGAGLGGRGFTSSHQVDSSVVISPLSSSGSTSAAQEKSSSSLSGRDVHSHMLSPPLSPRRESQPMSKSKSARNDLARLRSPASPRKRFNRDSLGKSPGSASKCLSFEENESSSGHRSGRERRVLLAGSGDSGPSERRVGSISSSSDGLDLLQQVDLINGTLATTSDGEEPDPDGIHQLLGPGDIAGSRCPRPSPYKPSRACEDATGSSNIPLPVPVASSLHEVKTEPSSPALSPLAKAFQSSSPSCCPPKEEKRVTLKPVRDGDVDMLPSDREEAMDAQNTEVILASPKQKSGQAHLSLSDKENKVGDAARRERLENIEMGKADSSYRLVGIVNHHGESLFAGHYTAFSFNFYKQRWFLMDDKHTRQASESNARRESTNSGYVFFYMDKEIFDKYEEKVAQRSNAT